MEINIERVIDSIHAWRGKAISVEPLPNGITNANFKVDVDGYSYFVRVPGEGSELLGIDRDHEHRNNQACRQLGISPEVVHYLPGLGVLVTEYLSLPALTAEDMKEPDVQKRLVRTMKLLHGSAPFGHAFNVFRLVDLYLRVIREKGLKPFSNYDDYVGHLAAIERVMVSNPIDPVPCHNDLVPENILDDGDKLYFVDFDYSGDNDPYFELGNLCVESDFSSQQVEGLVITYLGYANSTKIARTTLYGIMSDVGWSLWGIIQAEVSSLDLDFWTYGLKRWNRAADKMASSEFVRWLQTAQEAK